MEASAAASAEAAGSCPAGGGRSRRRARPRRRSGSSRPRGTRWTSEPYLEGGEVPMVAGRSSHSDGTAPARGTSKTSERFDQSREPAQAMASSAKGRGAGRKGQDWLRIGSDGWTRASFRGRPLRSGAGFLEGALGARVEGVWRQRGGRPGRVRVRACAALRACWRVRPSLALALEDARLVPAPLPAHLQSRAPINPIISPNKQALACTNSAGWPIACCREVVLLHTHRLRQRTSHCSRARSSHPYVHNNNATSNTSNRRHSKEAGSFKGRQAPP